MGLIELSEENGDGSAEIGIWIAPEYHGNGYGTEASKIVVEYAFKQLRYHRVFTRAFESNKGSQRIWEKLGFTKEGELREQAYREDNYENVHLYGLLENEWRE